MECPAEREEDSGLGGTAGLGCAEAGCKPGTWLTVWTGDIVDTFIASRTARRVGKRHAWR